jgi:hypothetical protein
MSFVSRVENSAGVPVAGVSVGASVPELSGLLLVTKKNIQEIKDKFKNGSTSSIKFYPTDESTDSCGVAVVTLVYTCPPTPGTSVGGDLTVFSGPLFSKPSQVTITLTEPDDKN